MKFQKILVAAVAFLALVSCKNDQKEAEAKSEKLPETFNVAFNLTVKKDDTFQLYYTEDGTLNFGDAMSIKSVVKGSEAPQEILFKLPVDVLPTNIRLDFGDNASQENVKINSMRLKYYDKVFEVKDNFVKNYFYMVDSQLKYDEATSTMVMVNTPGQTHDPFMWSNEALAIELKKLVQ